MKTSSSIKRNYFRRPVIRQLVPDLKLLLAVLQVGCESHIGCWVPSGLADDAGLSVEACEGGLRDLERSGFIVLDQGTGEIFLTDFFRNNTFRGTLRGQQALVDFKQVESNALRKRILEAVDKSPECGLSVEFLTGIIKNQPLKNQEKDQREVKEKTTPPTPPGGKEVEELVEASIWEIKQKGGVVGVGLPGHILDRVALQGMSERDLRTLEAFRNFNNRTENQFHKAPPPSVKRPRPGGIGLLSDHLRGGEA